MISICTIKRLGIVLASMLTLAACGSGSSSSTAGTNVRFSATPLAVNSAPNTTAGPKTFNTAEGHSVTLNAAYLVISSVTAETTCGATFTTLLDDVFNLILPPAHAHTTATPTSTGEPYVMNILSADNTATDIGAIQPPAADYCGATVDMRAADKDANNLPVGVGVPNDLIGASVYIEADYTLAGGGSGSFTINTSATLPRELMFTSPVMLSASNLNASVTLQIHYDTWFDTLDLTVLEAGSVDTRYGLELNQLLMNITNSIHQG